MYLVAAGQVSPRRAKQALHEIILAASWIADMSKGQLLLEELEQLDPDDAIDLVPVERICLELSVFNKELLDRTTGLLRGSRHENLASRLAGGPKRSDDQLFNMYFGMEAYSFRIPKDPPDKQDGCRAALVHFLSDALQSMLIDQLREIPAAKVMYSEESVNPAAFRRIYRHVAIRQVIGALIRVQNELEDFATRAEHLLQRPPPKQWRYRATRWAFGAQPVVEAVILGFRRQQEDGINPAMFSHPLMAAGLVRSHLESVLFRSDLASSIASRRRLSEDHWQQALELHKKAGVVIGDEPNWIRKTYDVLSQCLHTGSNLTRGDIKNNSIL